MAESAAPGAPPRTPSRLPGDREPDGEHPGPGCVLGLHRLRAVFFGRPQIEFAAARCASVPRKVLSPVPFFPAAAVKSRGRGAPPSCFREVCRFKTTVSNRAAIHPGLLILHADRKRKKRKRSIERVFPVTFSLDFERA